MTNDQISKGQVKPNRSIGFSQVTEERLQEVVRRIVQEFDPQRVVLFGSYACGEPGPDSDVDLLVVMESDERPAARATRVSRVLRPRLFPMDILVRTPDELRYRLEIGDYFIREIMDHGRVLYERSVSTRVD